MKKLSVFSTGIILFLIAPNLSFSQANTKLSNLVSPTAVNQHLLPNTNNTKYIGSTSKRWRQGFFYDKVSIRPSTDNANFPLYPLHIVNPSYSRGINVENTYIGNDDRAGVYSYSVNNPGYGYGVRGYGGYRGVYGQGVGGNYTGTSVGVYGTATGTAGNRYGVYGSASGGTFNAAGYFNGAVHAVSYNVISDRKFKTDITPLKNSLDKLMKLKPATYHFKTAQYGKIGLSEKNQLGLIADEIKQVFPELVTEAVQPAEYGEDKTEILSPETKYESVNYLGLIPVLIASIQEQQKTMAALKAENDEFKAVNEELKTRLNKLELNLGKTVNSVTLTSAKLTQNNPNPFNQNTIINYFVPEKAGKAFMNISDINGRVIKTVALTQKGNGQLVLDAQQLSPGSYQYSLSIGGRLIDTKKMVLIK